MPRGADERVLATIVIPTHDRPALANRAIRSALSQTVSNIEVVVVDDGSTPPFVPESDDGRVRVVRRDKAGGVSAARNRGIAVARGSWITFLDDDDELLPDMIERSVDAAKTSTLPSPVAVWSRMEMRADDGSIAGYCMPPTLERGGEYNIAARGNFRAHNTLVIPTAVVREIGGFDERMVVFQADDFGVRLNAAASLLAIDDVLYRMLHHDQPRLTKRSAAIAHDMELTLQRHAPAFRRHRHAHARYLSRLSIYHLRAGQWRKAARSSLHALVLDPLHGRAWFYAGAALGGPRVLAIFRGVGPRPDIPWYTLTKRRILKYSRRVLDIPRREVAKPLARMTWAMVRRRSPGFATATPRRVLLLSVYRQRNAGRLAPAVDEARSHGWDVRLWALDAADAQLASATDGAGPGAKFPLLNQLVDGEDLERFDWVVVSDDDLELSPGALGQLLAVAEDAGLDLIQPAHTERSHRTFPITLRKPLAVARRTSFVEIGPLFAVRQPWLRRVVPFPPRHDMGWGLELEWFDLAREGARLGIVDATAVRHLGPVGRGYRWRDEHDRLLRDVESRGLVSFRDIQQTLATWRPWQSAAPWR